MCKLRPHSYADKSSAHTSPRIEIAHDAFRTTDGGYAAFRRDRDGRVASIVFSGSIWDPSTADRVPWYQRAQVQLTMLLLAGLTFLTRLVAGGVRRIRRRRGGAVPPPTASWHLSGAQSLTFVAAPLIAPLGLFPTRPPFISPPWSIYACLVVLLIASGVGVVLFGLAWRDGRLGTQGRSERVLVWGVALASVVVTAFLWNWNLLGIHV